MHVRHALSLGLCLSAALPCVAQSPAAQLDPVVISVERSRQSSFDAAASISTVTRDVIDAGGLQVNLSEVLNRVPGISVLNRQNYAQDLQLSIRGFGSRSTFGIRGVRLIVDGIPATMPDGQGQASSIALGSAQRIEVLRGPMAQLYGNAAGGVVQVFTGADAQQPTGTFSLAGGPYGQRRLGARLAASAAEDEVVLDVSSYRTDGYREHSQARREQLNGKWSHEVSSDTRFSLVLNALDQPTSLDPLGLTRAQWEADPRQAVTIAKTQDARKSVSQEQMGGVLEHRLSEATQLTARVYLGARTLDNALSVPPTAQTAATSSGGIVSFARDYAGLGTQIAHTVRLGEARELRLVAGVEFDRMVEDRQGYLNTGGVRGALKRDERNSVENRDAFAQAAFDLSRQLTATAGLRASDVRFDSADRFIAPGNPDDSGNVSYSASNPVIGLSWRATRALNLYANVGRGFETPTFTELSYRPPCPATPGPVPCASTGLNTDLRASKSRHAEIGAKWKVAEGHRMELAVFNISTRDEIVVDTNNGGRSTFKNAGRTTRRGAEFQYLGQVTDGLRATLSLSALRARFAEGFVSGSGATAVNVPAGNRLPGTPERSAFAELAWAPKAAWGGFNAGIEVVHVGKLYFNDANADPLLRPDGSRNPDFAPAATVLNLRAGLAQKLGGWTFIQLLRIDNVSDKGYAGSVIVNDANNRYYEPALPRNAVLALTAKYEFR
jgi:iron complex outermembrane receptor protein